MKSLSWSRPASNRKQNVAFKHKHLLGIQPLSPSDITVILATDDSVNSIILGQVKNGIAVRMAVLYLLLGGKEREITD